MFHFSYVNQIRQKGNKMEKIKRDRKIIVIQYKQKDSEEEK